MIKFPYWCFLRRWAKIPKIQLISGHKNRESLSVYQYLSLSDIEEEYREAMKDFPIQ